MQVQNLKFDYKHRPVLNGLSFEVAAGEIVGVLGVNGAGKSTLLRILSGLLRSDSGHVQINDRRDMGVVFQESSLDLKLTAVQNLDLSGQVYGVPSILRKKRISEALRYFDLQDRASHLVKTFSGGMKRKLELARAMLHEPQLLLMDEPSAGLDQESFAKFWRMLFEHRQRRGLSVLVATHRVDEAENCDRLLVMHKGCIIANLTPDELRKQVHGDRIQLVFAPHMKESNREVIAENGHREVPRLVESFPDGALESISVRRPSLADAFLQLTGESL